MLVLREKEDIARIANPHVRSLVDLRYQQLGTFDAGLLLVIEVGDAIEDVERLCGVPILYDPFSDVPFGHPDYSPSFDYIEAHYAKGNITCFEAHADTSDDGLGTTIICPVEKGIDASLLAVLAAWVTPATGLMKS